MADNPRKLLYLSIYDRLSGLVTNGTIKRVDRWNNQRVNEAKERASITPTVLIQIENEFNDFSASGNDLQDGVIVTTCHILLDVKGRNGIDTQDWDVFQAVYERLNGQCVIDEDLVKTTPLLRTDEIEDNNYSGYYHGQLVFECHVEDCTSSDGNDLQTGTIDTLDDKYNGTTIGSV